MPVPMVEYLRKNYREPEPEWLQLAERASDPEVRREIVNGFLRSRIVYYPGAGRDGHPVKLFNQAHGAHAYIYVDYGLPEEDVRRYAEAAPGRPARGFRGYRHISVLEVKKDELTPWPIIWNLSSIEIQRATQWYPRIEPYALLYVYERQQPYEDQHGAKRFAVLYLCADGIAAYDAIFCQKKSVAVPFCVVVQDHGFGGNWGRYDRDSELELVAKRAGVRPELLLVAFHTSRHWRGYVPADMDGEALEPEPGGMGQHLRTLFRRNRSYSLEYESEVRERSDLWLDTYGRLFAQRLSAGL